MQTPGKSQGVKEKRIYFLFCSAVAEQRDEGEEEQPAEEGGGEAMVEEMRREDQREDRHVDGTYSSIILLPLLSLSTEASHLRQCDDASNR